MAQPQARVFRDYMLDDEDSWNVPSRRPSSLNQSSDRADTPQTVVLDQPSPAKQRSSNSIERRSNSRIEERSNSRVEERLNSRVEETAAGRIEYGIAQTTEDDINREHVVLHPGYGPGYGLASTAEESSYINDSSSSHSGGEPIEPTLEAAQVETPKVNGFANGTTIAMPPDVPKKRSTRQTMSPISERNTTHSIHSNTPSSHAPSKIDERMEHKMPEFFSMAVFQAALYNPTISHQLLKFGQSRLCGENMEFLARVHKYQALVNEVSRAVVEMHDEFISPAAPAQINVPEPVRMRTTQDAKLSLNSTVPQLENLFVHAQTDIENLVYSDVYPKFVRHQMTLSAAKALAGDRKQYAGLGDCFVLTDPCKADNPIVFASDGFVSVTGFQRNEIIPRNCRFLQGRSTHQASVRRLGKKIDKAEESVELLLNYKKTGEPFWNLLYTTPLFDSNGKLIFFLGGQINCSTTIHSTSDVLRILAESKDPVEGAGSGMVTPQLPAKPPRTRRILSAFRNNSSSNVQQRAPGMEKELLNQIEGVPLKDQMNTFHTAYSNYIIVNYSSFLITFVSTGLLDLLFPIKAAKAFGAHNNNSTFSTPAIGVDVFRFLANHGNGSLSWDFKSTIKNSLKLGNPVSLDHKLCARPYMGFEKFSLHWTPLKDERGAVQWVVLTLGNERRA